MTIIHNVCRFLAIVIIFATMGAFAAEPQRFETCGPESQARAVTAPETHTVGSGSDMVYLNFRRDDTNRLKLLNVGSLAAMPTTDGTRLMVIGMESSTLMDLRHAINQYADARWPTLKSDSEPAYRPTRTIVISDAHLRALIAALQAAYVQDGLAVVDLPGNTLRATLVSLHAAVYLPNLDATRHQR